MNISNTLCLLLTRDPLFSQKIYGILHALVDLKQLSNIDELDTTLIRRGSALILLDLRTKDSIQFLKKIEQQASNSVIIAFGMEGSMPMIEAENLDIFAVEDIEVNRKRLQSLVKRAVKAKELQAENELLKIDASKKISTSEEVSFNDKNNTSSLRHLYRAFKHFKDIDYLLESIVEGLASSSMVSRIGIFVWNETKDCYSMQAGLRCFDETQKMEFKQKDPLVKWMEHNARLFSRGTMQHVQDRSERALLNQFLCQFGAEIIIPLQSRTRLLGWLFMGQRATGLPFDYRDLEDLMVVTEHISTNLENALLYEELTLQKTTLETILNSLPTGTVVIGENNRVQWCNRSAQKFLDLPESKVLKEDAMVLGSKMNDILDRTLKNRQNYTEEWKDITGKRSMSIQTHTMSHDHMELGAVAILEDKTTEKMLQEKQEQLKRSQFWQELSSSLSHHIRNPLVAIRTFIQLLPERYDDPEFRNDFWKLLPGELDRLDQVIEQINQFANPPHSDLELLDIESVMQRGVELAQTWMPGSAKINTSVHEKLPKVMGDSKALAECFAHLIKNALEATADNKNAEINIAASKWQNQNDLVVTVKDNGTGIAEEEQDRVFAPFRTTKPASLGLGLPLVKRTVLDHKGNVTLSSNKMGTCVTVTLPADN
jgi:nitrogen-specific signal transduction histidine kinase